MLKYPAKRLSNENRDGRKEKFVSLEMPTLLNFFGFLFSFLIILTPFSI